MHGMAIHAVAGNLCLQRQRKPAKGKEQRTKNKKQTKENDSVFIVSRPSHTIPIPHNH